MATTISSTAYPTKLGSPPDFGTLYSGRALEFDGIIDSINCGNDAALDITGSLSLSAWVNVPNLSNNGVVVAKGNVGGEYSTVQYSLYVYNDNTVRFELSNGNGSEVDTTDTTDAIPVDTWTYLAAVFDASAGTTRIYINGEESVSDTSMGYTAIRSNTGNCSIGADIVSTRYYLNGKLANVQIWDAAWSASDVQYAYTHPEKFAYNTPGTSLTSSNLKAWYPMTEGNPRSPQTSVYDGSPKELGSELASSISFSGTGWAWDSDTKVLTGTTATGDGVSSSVLTTAVAGKVYKLTWDTSISSGGYYVSLGGSAATSQYTSGTSHVVYLTTGSTAQTVTFDPSDPFSGTISNISLKQVQMGNHGTTTFLGDELWDTDSATGTVVDNWTVEGSNTVAVDTNTIKITHEDNANGAYIRFRDAHDLSEDLVIGRTYRLSIDAKVNTGSVDLKLVLASGTTTFQSVIVTTFATYTVDFVAGHATNDYLGIGNMGSGEIIYLDNISLKEVGVSSSWTTADAEPLIPQTALMGMSKPMVFDGVDDYVNLGDRSDFEFAGSAGWTISMWIHPNKVNVLQGLINKRDGQTGFILTLQADATLQLFTGHTSGNTESDTSTTISANEWTHVVVSRPATATGTIDFYKNGSLMAMADDYTHQSQAAATGVDAFIGKHSDASRYFEGMINEVAIWESPLTLAEVQAIFNDGVALDVSSDSGNYASSDDLVGYYRNNSAISWGDESTKSNTGTPAGSPVTVLLPEGTTAGKDILGFPLTHTNNGWLNLSGSEYVRAEMGDALRPRTGDYSYECWVKRNGVPASRSQLIYAGQNSVAGRVYIAIETNGKIGIQQRFADDVQVADEHGGSAVTDGDWHHIVLVGDRVDGKFRLYIDSKKVLQFDYTAKDLTDGGSGNYLATSDLISTSTEPFKIGVNADLNAAFLDGQIDEVRFYKRALSDGLSGSDDTTDGDNLDVQAVGEILKNYNHGKSKHS